MTLHILNGDDTLQPFQESGVKGDIIIWREILSEGPVKNVPDEDFFQLRSDYICKNFGENPAQYHRKVTDEFYRIKNSLQYDNIFLWFEHDLVCQINLLFLLKTLSVNSSATENSSQSSAIRIVRFYEDEEQKKKFKGFGSLSGEQLRERFQHTILMNSTLLDIASMCWNVYTSNDAVEIEKLIPSIPKEFPFLKDALVAHLKRFPSAFNGLNEPQQHLLKIIAENSFSKREVIQKFLSDDHQYGITDILIERMLSDFQPELISKGEKIRLTVVGSKVFKGNQNFLLLGRKKN